MKNMDDELVELSVTQIKETIGQKDTVDDFFVFRA